MAWWKRVRGLYAIVDPSQCRDRNALWVAQEILAGGCAVMQLRAKNVADAELAELAQALRKLTAVSNVPFVVNDHVALAKAVGADGVHLGQEDMPVHEARGIVGDMMIGLSTHSLSQALDAVAAGADMIGFGPVYPTQSKPNVDPVVGLDALHQVAAQVSVPVVAIGGVNQARVHELIDSGAKLYAAISAVCGAQDPRAAAHGLHQI